MSQSINPILDFSGLPRYGEVVPGLLTPAITQIKAEVLAAQQAILAESNIPDWNNYLFEFLQAHEKICHAWKIIEHVHNVKDTKELLQDYQKAMLLFEDYDSDLWTNHKHYQKIKQIKEGHTFNTLPPTQQVVVKRMLQIFEDNGVALSADKQATLKEVRQQLAVAVSEFASRLQEANDEWVYLVTDRNELRGIPDDIVDSFKDPENEQHYRLTLFAPCFLPVMRFAENREIRQKLYCAFVTRASEMGANYGHRQFDKDYPDNAHFIELILKYRYEIATLLGYKNPAEQTLKDRMLNSASQVLDFLRDLARRAKPYAQKEFEELCQYAKETLKLDPLCAWDMSYASEKLSQEKFGFSEQDIRPYFELKRSLKGMFGLAKKLFDIDVIIESEKPSALHDSVSLCTVSYHGKAIGQFYLDPFARMNKHGGAWMDEVISRQRFPNGVIRLPVAQLVCNFTEPGENRPTLLSHDELLTLFHEFGHVLHHVLTQVDEYFVGGINGVEWDGVELPSQFMENFGWQWSVISPLSCHIETGQSMPKALFDKLRTAKNFQVGMRMLKQIEYALFDMQLHCDFDPSSAEKTFQDVLDQTRQEVAVVIPPAFDRFAHAFSHIFAGGYGAGYYSYKWSDILCSDAFARFIENAKENNTDIVSTELGSAFKKEILSVGSTRPMKASFEAFRGRQPTIDAYLASCFED